MLTYTAATQTGSMADLWPVFLTITGSVLTMLSVAGVAMKRMVDSHFENVKYLRERADALEAKENLLIDQVATLREQVREANETRERQKQAHDGEIERLREQHSAEIVSKDGEIKRLKQEIETLQRQIDGLRGELEGVRRELDGLIEKHETVVHERDELRSRVNSLTEDSEQMQREIQSVIREHEVDREVGKVLESRLREGGMDTGELQALRDAVRSKIEGKRRS